MSGKGAITRAMSIRPLWLGLPPLLVFAAAAVLVQVLAARYEDAVDRKAGERLTLYRETILGEYAKYRYLPYVLARDPRATSVLNAPEGVDAANRFLQELAEVSGASLLYVMDADGKTLVASNWREPLSLVGRNYGFRPYFAEAMQGREGRFFATGATTGEPGLFLSRPTPVDGPPRGAAIVKVDMRPLERAWADGGEIVFASDAHGVIFLSSVADWRYRTLDPLAPPVRQLIESTRQYADRPLEPLGTGTARGSPVMEIAGHRYRRSSIDVGLLGWTLHFLTPVKETRRELWMVWASASGVGLLYVLVIVAMRGRAFRRASLVLRRESAELRELNERLVDEVEERRRVERELREAQAGLDRANRLAAVGQMSAAVAHELNQPLAALRMFVAGARLFLDKGEQASVRENLDEIESLQHRMASLTQELKRFARPGESKIETVDLRDSVAAAVKIAAPRFEETGVALSLDLPGEALTVKTAALRVEQILLNLLRNAADAASHGEAGRVRLSARRGDGEIVVSVADNGAGVPDDLKDRIFDPFFTTKLSSGGLGLGLSISGSIADDLGGSLVLHSNDAGGATFDLHVPVGAGPASRQPQAGRARKERVLADG